MTDPGTLDGWHNLLDAAPPVIASLSSNPRAGAERSRGPAPHLERHRDGSRFDYAQRETGGCSTSSQ
jgi:hypothetical protein